MENASKALAIAAGVLIGVLTIGLLVYLFSSAGSMFNEEKKGIEVQQLKEFNDQYESYHRNLLRGTDVISIINKMINNNTKYGPSGSNETEYLMSMEFEMKEELVYTKNGIADVSFEVGSRYNISSFTTIKNNADAFTDFKRRIFDCKQVKYNKNTGRVNYMLFIERKMTDSEYESGIIH